MSPVSRNGVLPDFQADLRWDPKNSGTVCWDSFTLSIVSVSFSFTLQVLPSVVRWETRWAHSPFKSRISIAQCACQGIELHSRSVNTVGWRRSTCSKQGGARDAGLSFVFIERFPFGECGRRERVCMSGWGGGCLAPEFS